MRQLGLLERERELALVGASIASARAGDGSLLLIEGPAGIGKTAVLDEGCRRAGLAGMSVLRARGGVHEGDIAHGIVRQLFEPAVRRMTGGRLAALLSGAAALAGPVLGGAAPPPPEGPSPSRDPQAVVHGLYWATATIADAAPLLLAVDDAHWADAASLLYLLYLARRLEGMPVLVLLATRGGEAPMNGPVLDEISACERTRRVQLSALSVDAVADLAREHLGPDAEGGFIAVCHEVTGGVPFLVVEALAALAIDGVRPVASEAARIRRLAPAGVVAAVMLRLARLSPASAPVARAVAILGRHAHVHRVAALAGVDQAQALDAVDGLVTAAILQRARPLSFVHPLLAAAVDEDLPTGTRSMLHARAAALLLAEGSDVEDVATHLLASDPDGSHSAVATLRTAADQALSRGAPHGAVAYLRRALAEPIAPGERGELLRQLGMAEAMLRDPQCIEHLDAAMKLAPDARGRARLACDLAPILAYAGEWDAVTTLVRSTAAELGDEDPQTSGELLAFRAAIALYDPAQMQDFERDRADLLQRARSTGGGPLAFVLAAAFGFRGENPALAIELAEQGLDGGRYMAERGGTDPLLHQAVGAFVWSDAPDRGEALANAMVDDSIRCGSVMGFVGSSADRGWVHCVQGSLRAAEVDLRAALEVARQHDLLVMPTPVMLWYGREAILERPQLDDLATLAETIELPPALLATMTGAGHFELRGRVRLLRGDVEAGVDDLRRCGTIFTALRSVPQHSAWRSVLALALAGTEREEAAGLVAEELELAVATGLPTAHGVALRAAGLLTGGDEGIALLERSLSVLECSPATLQRARTLVDLGAAQRRGNRRAASREPLRAGLELAYRCGADRLAARALEELRATGARPRRPVISGREALTPSEGRVAALAATGVSNRAIAQSLFVTERTVENQLGAVYRKLGIGGRRQLAAALDEVRTTA